MENQSKGLGLVGILTIIFVVFKLLGLINWSWVWVLSPLWIGFLVTAMFVVFAVLVAFMCAVASTFGE